MENVCKVIQISMDVSAVIFESMVVFTYLGLAVALATWYNNSDELWHTGNSIEGIAVLLSISRILSKFCYGGYSKGWGE